MAKDAEKGKDEDKAKDEGVEKPKKSKKLLVIILIVVILTVVIAGGLLGLLMLKRGSAQEADTDAPARVDLSRPPVFVTLEPFTVNLAPDEGHRLLQVIIAVRVTDARTGENLKGFMPEIRHRVNLLLSSKLPSEVATPGGRETLARQIADEMNVVLGGTRDGDGPIQAVLFNSFIVQ